MIALALEQKSERSKLSIPAAVWLWAALSVLTWWGVWWLVCWAVS